MHAELKEFISQSMNERHDFERKLIERAWEDEAFKQELLSNSQAVYARESGEELPKDLEIEVLQENGNKVYLVLPIKSTPAMADEEELSEEALETVAGGVGIGVTCVLLKTLVGRPPCALWTRPLRAGDTV